MYFHPSFIDCKGCNTENGDTSGDVKISFLNGDLTEEIYMIQPKGFIVKGLELKVCKLVRSLYGMKQAPKMWNDKFDKVIKSNGYKSVMLRSVFTQNLLMDKESSYVFMWMISLSFVLTKRL